MPRASAVDVGVVVVVVVVHVAWHDSEVRRPSVVGGQAAGDGRCQAR